MTDSYVRDQNIQRFSRMLEREADPQKRVLIERLLTEERANTTGAGIVSPLSEPED